MVPEAGGGLQAVDIPHPGQGRAYCNSWLL
jgi:hypothetical protein